MKNLRGKIEFENRDRVASRACSQVRYGLWCRLRSSLIWSPDQGQVRLHVFRKISRLARLL